MICFLLNKAISVASIRKANAVHPIAALQSEYSLLTRDVEKEILPTLRGLGISLIPFSPLSRGLITDTGVDMTHIPDNDFRKTSTPRFSGEFLKNNLSLSQAFKQYTVTKGCTAAQLALAWILAQGENIIPIPCTKKQKYLIENAESVNVQLNEEDRLAIETILATYPNVGV